MKIFLTFAFLAVAITTSSGATIETVFVPTVDTEEAPLAAPSPVQPVGHRFTPLSVVKAEAVEKEAAAAVEEVEDKVEVEEKEVAPLEDLEEAMTRGSICPLPIKKPNGRSYNEYFAPDNKQCDKYHSCSIRTR